MVAQANGFLPASDLDRILADVKKTLPDRPRLEDIKWEEYLTSTDDEAIQFFLVMPDEAAEDDLNLRRITQIEDMIRSRLEEAGEQRWPYFWIGTREEYDRWHEPTEDVGG